MNKKDIINEINKNLTIKELSVFFNKSPTTIRYWLKKYGLKTKRARVSEKRICVNCGNKLNKKSKKFCSSICFSDYNYNNFIEGWLSRDIEEEKIKKKTNVPSGHIYRYFKENFSSCQICGISEWNGKPIILHLDHIDGDRNNCWIENLRHICPNCDSQTEFYKGRNSKVESQYPYISINRCINCNGLVEIKNSSDKHRNKKFCSRKCALNNLHKNKKIN